MPRFRITIMAPEVFDVVAFNTKSAERIGKQMLYEDYEPPAFLHSIIDSEATPDEQPPDTPPEDPARGSSGAKAAVA